MRVIGSIKVTVQSSGLKKNSSQVGRLGSWKARKPGSWDAIRLKGEGLRFRVQG
jgi:hypothetical protein